MDQNEYENEQFGAPQKPITEKESADVTPPEQPAEPAAAQPYPPAQPQQAFPQQPQQQAFPQQPQQQAFPQQPQQQAFPQQPPQQAWQPYPPQQPFPPQQGGNYGFQPEKPLMQPQQPQLQQPQAPQHPAAESYDPMRHTAVYQNGAFVNPEPQPPYPPQTVPTAYPQPYGQPAFPPQNPNPYAPPAGDPYPQPESAPQKPKEKSNKGMVAVIIVLSALLAGSLAGLLTYVLVHAGQNGKQENSNNFSYRETLPNNNDDPFKIPQEETTTAPPTHEESDYSDKIIPDYGGLKLEPKPEDTKDSKYTSEYAFDSVSESVVGVMCYSDSNKARLVSQGSGIIISQGGYVITNAHVIGNSKSAYALKVVTADGKEYNAGVVGFDSRTDLAVLKMDGAKDLKAATFGDSAELTLGEDIIVIGNPGGLNYQNSMTKGIVSALDRDASSKSLVKYIQTDAAINPGNSGGPAVNMFGQVIGVASSKIAGVTYEGMAFCIPTQTVKTIVDDLIRNGYVEGRVRIGIAGHELGIETATINNVPQGILVKSVDENGPCGGTELRAGDIITGMDDEKVVNFSNLYNILEKHKAGDKVTLKYYQASTGKEVEEEITLAEDK